MRTTDQKVRTLNPKPEYSREGIPLTEEPDRRNWRIRQKKGWDSVELEPTLPKGLCKYRNKMTGARVI